MSSDEVSQWVFVVICDIIALNGAYMRNMSYMYTYAILLLSLYLEPRIPWNLYIAIV
jgi:hypothetical protein